MAVEIAEKLIEEYLSDVEMEQQPICKTLALGIEYGSKLRLRWQNEVRWCRRSWKALRRC